MLDVRGVAAVWRVPSQLAAWVSPGVTHALKILTGAELLIVHVHLEAIQAWSFEALTTRSFALPVTTAFCRYAEAPIL